MTTSHRTALLQALLVTVLWSTSWVLIKITLNDTLPALTFAGLRYVLACICLSPLVIFSRKHRSAITALPGKEWGQLFLYGFICYSLAQGALFIALRFIPAATISLLLNMAPVVVGVVGIPLLHEYPARVQWVGVVVSLGGVFLYFLSRSFPIDQVVGVCAALACMLANVGSAVYGRLINSRMNLSPLIITFVSMGFGSMLLLTTGLIVEGAGEIDLRQWLVIVWLAVVNTALAWSLWNRSLRVLSAIESSIIGGLMLPQTALLAFVFLGETLSLIQIGGLILVGVGALMVQLKRKKNLPAE